MRNPDTNEIQWAQESYRQISRGIFGDGSGTFEHSHERELPFEESAEIVENQFQKLAERFNEFFGHPSK